MEASERALREDGDVVVCVNLASGIWSMVFPPQPGLVDRNAVVAPKDPHALVHWVATTLEEALEDDDFAQRTGRHDNLLLKK